MSRNDFNLRFRNMSQEVLLPGLELLAINGQWLHPVIAPIVVDDKLVQTGGGFDNSHTMFGITTPSAHGKSLYVQVSPKTEELIEADNIHAIEFLRSDLRAAVKLWGAKSVDHTHALERMIIL